jgi:hypothetical protein
MNEIHATMSPSARDRNDPCITHVVDLIPHPSACVEAAWSKQRFEDELDYCLSSGRVLRRSGGAIDCERGLNVRCGGGPAPLSFSSRAPIRESA